MGAKGQPKTGGRRKGSINRTTREMREAAARAAENHETPLDHLLRIINDVDETKERRLRAAGVAAPFCHPKALVVAGPNGEPLGGGGKARVVLYLPDNGRDPELVAAHGGRSLEERAEHEKRRAEFVEGQDKKLRDLVSHERLTEAQAVLVRCTLYQQPGDVRWKPMAQPAPPVRQVSYNPAEMQTPTVNGTVPELPMGNEIELSPEPVPVILYAGRNSLYQVETRFYRANGRGEIVVNEPADVAELLAMNCRRQP